MVTTAMESSCIRIFCLLVDYKVKKLDRQVQVG